MHQHPARVPHNLPEATEEHGEEECPCSIAEAQVGLRGESEGKDGEEEGVCTEGGHVFESCIVFGTSVEGAERRVVPGGPVECGGFSGKGEVLRCGHDYVGRVLWRNEYEL